MKIYISAAIEGIAGITHWDETDRLKPEGCRRCDHQYPSPSCGRKNPGSEDPVLISPQLPAPLPARRLTGRRVEPTARREDQVFYV